MASTFHRDVCLALEVPVRDTARMARLSLQWWANLLDQKEVRQSGAVTLSADEREMLTFMLEDLERRSADMVTIMSGPQLAPVD